MPAIRSGKNEDLRDTSSVSFFFFFFFWDDSPSPAMMELYFISLPAEVSNSLTRPGQELSPGAPWRPLAGQPIVHWRIGWTQFGPDWGLGFPSVATQPGLTSEWTELSRMYWRLSLQLQQRTSPGLMLVCVCVSVSLVKSPQSVCSSPNVLLVVVVVVTPRCRVYITCK